jgi:hypothetical protein
MGEESEGISCQNDIVVKRVEILGEFCENYF